MSKGNLCYPLSNLSLYLLISLQLYHPHFESKGLELFTLKSMSFPIATFSNKLLLMLYLLFLILSSIL